MAMKKPWLDGTKFRQDSRPFSVATRNMPRQIGAMVPDGSLVLRNGYLDSSRTGTMKPKPSLYGFVPSGSGKNLAYDGVNTDYWVVKGTITNATGETFEGYHGVIWDKDDETLDLVTPPFVSKPNKAYYAQELIAKAFYNPEISAALSEAQGSSGVDEFGNWWMNYGLQKEEYDSIQKKGAFHFMNLTSGIQMKALKEYAELYGTDSLDEIVYSLFSQDGTAQFSYGNYVGPEIGAPKGEDGGKSKKTIAMIKAVQESEVAQPVLDPDMLQQARAGDLFYNLGYLNVDNKSNRVGPELSWTSQLYSQDAFGPKSKNLVLTSNERVYVGKNTKDNPVKFNPKNTFQFTRTYLIDVGTKKKQRITYKSRKAGDGLVVWKEQNVAKKAASAARSKGYLMRTVPVATGWVNLAAKRKNYPEWHPLYSKHNRNLIANGKLPKNFREYHRR